MILKKMLQILDGLTGLAINVFLIAALAFGGYSLWDTCQIMEKADPGRVQMLRPDLKKEEKLSFEGLTSINPDVCAWITIDGTGIDFPVVQGPDNQTYINTTIFGEYALSGSIFLDSANSRDFSDPYSLIYGHHMEGGRMFGALDAFLDPGFFETHCTGTLLLPGKSVRICWFCMVRTDAFDEQIFSPGSIHEEQIEDFTRRLKRNALHKKEYQQDDIKKDRLIALSTCSEAGSTGRLLLAGYLQGPDETRTVRKRNIDNTIKRKEEK